MYQQLGKRLMVQNVSEAKEEIEKRMNFQKNIMKSKCDNIFYKLTTIIYIFLFYRGVFGQTSSVYIR